MGHDVYYAASLRHHKDSELLSKEKRFDNAFYHAQFAIECGLKQMMPNLPSNSHNVSGLINSLNSIDPRAAKLPKYSGATHNFPNCRYFADGHAKEIDVVYALQYWTDHMSARMAACALNGGKP